MQLEDSETNKVLFQVLVMVNTEISLSWKCSIHINISKDSAAPFFRAGRYLPTYCSTLYQISKQSYSVINNCPQFTAKLLMHNLKKKLSYSQ